MKTLHLALILYFFSIQATLEQYTYGKGTVKPLTPIDSPIQRAQLYGERCSGTTFFAHLFQENCPILISNYYGHKHFPSWFDYPYDGTFYKRPLHEWTLQGSDDVLFLIIFRNPYNWLQSLQKKPFHTFMRNMTFSQFIRSPWLTRSSFDKWKAIDLDPNTRTFFKNVLHLRTEKIKNMLKLEDLVKHAYFINYEILCAHPQQVLQEIHEVFGISLNETFKPVLEHFVGGTNKGKLFKESKYAPISSEDMDFINKTLDENLENSIGYILFKETNNLK